ncbi:MAG: nitroreductase/quinone reductase family protein [Dermatophilaceae bacterium]
MAGVLSGVVSRWLRSAGGTPLGVWAIKTLVSPAQQRVYRLSRGRVSLTGRLPVMLLTTTGRRSGKPRTVPVFYVREDDDFVICNVRPPGERANPWVLNLRAHPNVLVEVSGARLRARARAATEAEVASFWPRLVRLWPAYEDFHLAGGQRSLYVLERRNPV